MVKSEITHINMGDQRNILDKLVDTIADIYTKAKF